MAQSNLFLATKQCLDTKDPAEKVALTTALYQAWQTDQLTPIDDQQIQTIGPPGRPERPRLVPVHYTHLELQGRRPHLVR